MPLVSGQGERIQKLIADLGSNQFAVREGASRELASLGAEVRPALGRALTAKPSVEARLTLEARAALERLGRQTGGQSPVRR